MNIVLIHIGNKNIDYVIDTFRHLLKYKNKNIFFLANKKIINKLKFNKISKTIKLHYLDDIEISKKHEIFLNKNNLDKKFGNGFWIKTLERFFYLESFCQNKKFKNIIHLENDVLIFDDLDKYKNIFSKNFNIGMTFLNQKLCVPGFIFFKDYKKLNFLCNYIVKKNKYFFQKKNKNDMKLLAEMYDDFRNIKKYKIRLLPTMNNEIGKFVNSDLQDKKPFYDYYKKFGVIFDACALGQKIGGLDPKFHKIKGSYINPLNIFDVNNIEIIIKKINNDKRPFLKINKKLVRILNIHMHSKKTNFFLN